jgi:Family of unknown function (DUF6111)
MARLLFQYLLPLVLPILLYVSYIYLSNGNTPGWIRRAPWAVLIGVGAALVGVSLVAWGLFEGAEPGLTYVPSHVDEDGRVVPGTFVEPDS